MTNFPSEIKTEDSFLTEIRMIQIIIKMTKKTTRVMTKNLQLSLLSQQHVKNQHHAKSHQEGIGCASLVAVGVSLGDHFVADNI